jgi:hypothetical protein
MRETAIVFIILLLLLTIISIFGGSARVDSPSNPFGYERFEEEEENFEEEEEEGKEHFEEEEEERFEEEETEERFNEGAEEDKDENFVADYAALVPQARRNSPPRPYHVEEFASF